MSKSLTNQPSRKEVEIKALLERGPLPVSEVLSTLGIKYGYFGQLLTIMRKRGEVIQTRQGILSYGNSPVTRTPNPRSHPRKVIQATPDTALIEQMVGKRLEALQTAISYKGMNNMPSILSALDELVVKVLTS